MKKKAQQTKTNKVVSTNNQSTNTTYSQPETQYSIEQIELTQIDCNPYNPRKKYSEEDIKELADSIAIHGVIQPITLRKVEDKYQIVCGERRYRAALLLGLTSICAIVRPYTQEQAIEVTIIENLQRKDILPMEEAISFNLLMQKHNYGVEDLVKRFGKSEKFIRGRLLLSNLIDEVAQLLNNGAITISVAMIIAEYPSEVQNEVYKEHLTDEGFNSWKELTVNKFSERILNKYASNLNDFDFDKTECLNCRSNSANNCIFSDSECGSCTNRTCMLAKQKEYLITYSKQQIEVDPSVVFCFSPNSDIDEDVIQTIGEAGCDIYEIQPFSYPKIPQMPVTEDNDYDTDIQKKEQQYEEEYNLYLDKIKNIEEKIELGIYQKMINISDNTPKPCFRIVVPEQKNSSKENSSETPAKKQQEELRKKDTRNKEIVVERTIEDIKKMLNKIEIPTSDITEKEEELLYFVMLKSIRQDHMNIFKIEESYSFSDETKAMVIKNLTMEQKAIIKRDFIIKHLSDTFGTNKKSELLLEFARIHFNKEVNSIIKPYELVYKKRRYSIMKRLKAIGGVLQPKKIEKEENKQYDTPVDKAS